MDLNVNIVAATDSTFCDEEDQAEMVIMEVPEASRSTPMEDSGSSNSSVVNAEFNRELEDSNSNSNTTATTTTTTTTAEALIFDILKKEKDGLYMDRVASPSPGFVTRSFFPVAMATEKGGIGEPGYSAASGFSSSSSRPQWLNLSFADGQPPGSASSSAAGANTELKVMQQKQQMKKSRRGPRSRSSQYRGVTFYRRTGRWESHIWCVFK